MIYLEIFGLFIFALYLFMAAIGLLLFGSVKEALLWFIYIHKL
jgi:hypothetical protein